MTLPRSKNHFPHALNGFFKPFVEDDLDGLFPPGRLRRLLAHPAAPGLIDAVPPGGTAAVVAIGPEGGFTPYEASSMAARGFLPFSLGPRPLRVDVAVPFAVGQAEQWLFSAAGRMLFILLANPQTGLMVAPGPGGDPVQSISAMDAISLMSLLIILTAELIVLGFSVWLLFRTTKASAGGEALGAV